MRLRSRRLRIHKSPAGDKFETGRERLQQKLDRLGAQLLYLQEQRTALEVVGRKEPTSQASLGSLVTFDNRSRYLIAEGYGKLKLIDQTDVFVISKESPVGEALFHKNVGDRFEFRGKKLELKSIG